MTGSVADAEEIAQETFTRALAAPPGAILGRSWIFSVATNLARDRLRRRKRAGYVGPWLPGGDGGRGRPRIDRPRAALWTEGERVVRLPRRARAAHLAPARGAPAPGRVRSLGGGDRGRPSHARRGGAGDAPPGPRGARWVRRGAHPRRAGATGTGPWRARAPRRRGGQRRSCRGSRRCSPSRRRSTPTVPDASGRCASSSAEPGASRGSPSSAVSACPEFPPGSPSWKTSTARRRSWWTRRLLQARTSRRGWC